MNHTVYLSNPFIQAIIPMLQPDWTVIKGWDESSPQSKQSVTALATTIWDKVDAPYLSQFPNVRIVTHLGIGTDNIDKDYLHEHNINLMSQPDSGIHDTAELALTLMLTLARKIIPNHHYSRANHWAEGTTRFLGNHLFEKKLGLVGLGKIGTLISHFGQALGMKIAYTTRTKRDSAYQYFADVNELAQYSDFLIICCAGGPETRHLIDQTVLVNLGEAGYLINVSRGSVVDEDALITALNKRVIAGAGLDVYANEPQIPSSLRELDNVVLSPHMGSSTHENLKYMFHVQAQQLNQFLYAQ